MKRKLLILLLLSVVELSYAQSLQTRLNNLTDSLSLILSIKQQRITQFKFNRTVNYNNLIVDIKRNLPIYRAPFNANAAITTGAAKLISGAIGLNLSGKGFTIGMWDDGQPKNHVELGNRVVSKEMAAVQFHTTHVAGTLIAAGINPAAKGMASQAYLSTWYFDNDEAEIAAQATTDQSTLLFSNHSYGQVTGFRKEGNFWHWAGDASISADEDFYFGFYGDRAQIFDQIVYLSPYSTIVWAAGNDRAELGDGTHPPDCNKGTGYDCIIPDAVGKNIITVGAVDAVLNYNGPSSVPMSFYSSWGPTDDGRIKPDLVGDGTNLFSLSNDGVNTYATTSGTSMATPNVTGSLLLLQELYSRLHGGKLMKAATLKALAIHTTKEVGNFPGPDYSFGWGLLDVEAGANVLLKEDGVNSVITETTLTNGEKKEWTLTPKASQKITATIVWVDPAGKPVADALDPPDLMLVNDLDIKIIDDAGNETLPWVLDPGTLSVGATKGNNFRDNVEKIEFDLPAAKNYRLIVSHKKTLVNGAQDFSLVLTYQSTTIAPQTYYWIGDTGSWNDPTHWASKSGGVTNKIPTAADNVIVDENSFNGTAPAQINLSQNQSVNSLLWLTSKSAGISLNNYKLQIGKNLTIGYEDFKIVSAGTIQASTASSGTISFYNNQLPLADLIISTGNWKLIGNTQLNQLTLDGGSLGITNSQLQLNKLTAISSTTKSLDVNNSSITLTQQSDINSTGLTLSQSSSSIISSGNTSVNWQTVKWTGDFIVNNGKAVITGDNSFSKLNLNGTLETKGNNTIDSLVIASPSSITIGAATNQTIGDLQIMNANTVSIGSTSTSSLTFTQHKKYCFDHLSVSNVDVKGIAVVNAGLNSTLTNSKGWLSQNCSDVLFADFSIQYPCEGGVTLFKDKSTGNSSQWSWSFPNSITGQLQNTEFSFDTTGKYPVTLTVSNSVSSDSFTKEVNVVANTLKSNQVVSNSDELYSFNQAAAYQWYRNENPIQAETNRAYAYKGAEGAYAVLTYDDQCNRLSDKTVITEVVESDSELHIYPNPADKNVMITNSQASFNMRVVDLAGRTVLKANSTSGALALPVSELSDGIYLVEIISSSEIHREKLMIVH